jgi:alpha-tubulin suppressor-like RCC1 family protein
MPTIEPTVEPVDGALPTHPNAIGRLRAVHISAGCRHSALVTQQGSAYTWGLNQRGCLGVVPAVSADRATSLGMGVGATRLQAPPSEWHVPTKVLFRTTGTGETDMGDTDAHGEGEYGGGGGTRSCDSSGGIYEATVHVVAVSAGLAHTLFVSREGQSVRHLGKRARTTSYWCDYKYVWKSQMPERVVDWSHAPIVSLASFLFR